MRSTRILLVRHGHTAGNDAGPSAPMSGWADLPLSETGRAQAERAAALLAREPRPDCVYTSPLRRAADTARIIAGEVLAPVLESADVKEIHCGDADGLPIAEVQRRFAAHWAANLRQTDEDFRWPGGESYRELRARALAGVRRIAAAHAGGRVVVVTHAGVVSQILGWLEGVGAACWERRRPGNASLTELDWAGDAGLLLRFDVRA